jgi:GntR family transcriptional regulator, transcriptional repressor for pyruvate dehydrogenase complex
MIPPTGRRVPIPADEAKSGLRIPRQVRVPKTADLVADHLRRQIVRGELREGDALPPETELMEMFGVSRPTLREAFRVLESEALMSVRRGAHGGGVVHAPNIDSAARYAGLVLEYRSTTLADVYEARNALEPPCVALVAATRTEDDLRVLRAALARETDTAASIEQRVVRQTSFHDLLIERCGNETLKLLTSMLGHITSAATLARVTTDSNGHGDEMVHLGAKAHAKLMTLIEARVATEAEAVWRRHLSDTTRYLLGQPGANTVLDLLG